MYTGKRGFASESKQKKIKDILRTPTRVGDGSISISISMVKFIIPPKEQYSIFLLLFISLLLLFIRPF